MFSKASVDSRMPQAASTEGPCAVDKAYTRIYTIGYIFININEDTGSCDIDKCCAVVKNSVYLSRILLLPVKHGPRMKRHSKHLPIMGALRLTRLRIHISPPGV